MPAPRKLKTMPEEVKVQLSQVERIKAYFEDSYELDDDDQAYLHKIDLVFKVVHADDNINDARAKLKHLFPELNLTGINLLIKNAQAIYANFFDINEEVMKVMQEQRRMKIYHAALRSGDTQAANAALTAIDKLHGLYLKKPKGAKINIPLPVVRRTADPAALKNLNKDD